jgi:hypothetical protein
MQIGNGASRRDSGEKRLIRIPEYEASAGLMLQDRYEYPTGFLELAWA